MTSMLFNVGLLLFLLSNEVDYTSALPETFLLDEYLKQTFECVFHVACNLSEPLKIKKAVDLFKDEQIEFLLEKGVPKLDKHLQVMKSVEEMRSDDAWVNVYTKVACAASKEDQNKAIGTLFAEFVEHLSEICHDVARIDQCEAVNEGNKVYHEMEAEMIERKECEVYGQTLP